MDGIKYPAYMQQYNALSVERRIELFEKALKEHPEDEYLLKMNIAIMCFSYPEQHNKCLNLCDELINKCDDQNLVAGAYYFSACLLEDENTDKAETIRRFKCLLELYPDEGATLDNLFDIYLKDKNYNEAKRYAERLCDVEDYEYIGFHNLGDIYRELKKYDIAIEYYKKSDENDVDNFSDSLYQVAVCYVEKKENDKAIETLKSAIERKPNNEIFYYGLGLCLQKNGDYYRALDNYSKAIKLQPDFPDAYNNIAFIFVESEGDFKKAAEYLEKALEISALDPNPNNVMYFMNLYRIFKHMKDFDKADYYYKKYLACFGMDGLYDFLSEDDYPE